MRKWLARLLVFVLLLAMLSIGTMSVSAIQLTYSTTSDGTCNSCNEHIYSNDCDRDCNICNEIRVAPHVYDNACDRICDACGNVRVVEDHAYTDECDIDCNKCGAIRIAPHNYENACDDVCDTCGNMRIVEPHIYANDCDDACDTCGEVRVAPHIYGHKYDESCNDCGYIRKVEVPIAFGGTSIHEHVSGLAFRFDVAVQGMSLAEDHFTAIYDGATVDGYKLLGMGAIAANQFDSVDIPCVYLCDLQNSTAGFAIRIIDIPAAAYDMDITVTPYITVEIDGVATTIYGVAQSISYSGAIKYPRLSSMGGSWEAFYKKDGALIRTTHIFYADPDEEGEMQDETNEIFTYGAMEGVYWPAEKIELGEGESLSDFESLVWEGDTYYLMGGGFVMEGRHEEVNNKVTIIDYYSNNKQVVLKRTSVNTLEVISVDPEIEYADIPVGTVLTFKEGE